VIDHLGNGQFPLRFRQEVDARQFFPKRATVEVAHDPPQTPPLRRSERRNR